MAIKCDFEFKGITVDGGYIKVGSVSIHNYPTKEWVATLNKYPVEGGELLCGSESVTFPYVEGQDPIKQAYSKIKEKYSGIDV